MLQKSSKMGLEGHFVPQIKPNTTTMSKILLTGSAGYLGTYLYTRLKELGCRVTGIDQRSHSTVDRVVDISNAEAVEGIQLILINYLGDN